MNHMKVRALCEGAVLLAVAQILSYIKLWEMPWGGSIVLSMVPLVLYAVRWGLGAGLLNGFLFGVLQFMFDGGFAIGWESIIGDYLLAFTVLGLAGLFARRRSGVFLGTLVAGGARFLVHYIGGRHHLGRLHARHLLRHDHAQPLVLLPAVQSGLYAAQHRHHAGGVRHRLQAAGQVPDRRRSGAGTGQVRKHLPFRAGLRPLPPYRSPARLFSSECEKSS